MKELELIGREVEKLRAAGKSAVLATVVNIEGSSYRLPGARMLIADMTWKAGSVSGGCLESDVVLRARDALDKKQAAVVTYDTTSDEDIVFGVGLGCRGIIKVLIEPITPQRAEPDLVTFIMRCIDRRQTGVVATVIGVEGQVNAKPGRRLVRSADGGIGSDIADGALNAAIEAYLARSPGDSHTTTFDLAEGTAQVFVEVVRPPIPFVVFGAGHDAIPVVRLAKELGWHVTVSDHRAAYATVERFPLADEVLVASPNEMVGRISLTSETVALVMTHSYLRDLELLKILLPSPVRYVGLLGPRKRADELLAELERQSIRITPEQRRRLYAPVGLDLGAEGPEGVALSILAEIQSVIASREPGHLRARKSAIHGV